MEKIEWPRLGPMELARGLTGCVAGGECEGCPLYGLTGTLECIDELRRQAAGMIGRLYDANEKTADGLARRLADMAREGNTALERGLEGVNLAKLAEMTGIQSELEALGRGSVIRAEPAGRQDGSMRIQEVVVEGRVVFCTDAQEIATSPAAPRNDMETGGPDG